MDSVTSRIRDAILSSPVSRAEISRASDVPQSVLCRFALGRSTLSGKHVDRLARYFDLALTPRASRKRGER